MLFVYVCASMCAHARVYTKQRLKLFTLIHLLNENSCVNPLSVLSKCFRTTKQSGWFWTDIPTAICCEVDKCLKEKVQCVWLKLVAKSCECEIMVPKFVSSQTNCVQKASENVFCSRLSQCVHVECFPLMWILPKLNNITQMWCPRCRTL